MATCRRAAAVICAVTICALAIDAPVAGQSMEAQFGYESVTQRNETIALIEQLEQRHAMGECDAFHALIPRIRKRAMAPDLRDRFLAFASRRCGPAVNAVAPRHSAMLQRMAEIVREARDADSSHRSASGRCDIESRKHWSEQIERIQKQALDLTPDSDLLASPAWQAP